MRLIDVLLREGKRYRTPEERLVQQNGAVPQAARPGRQRRSKQATAVD